MAIRNVPLSDGSPRSKSRSWPEAHCWPCRSAGRSERPSRRGSSPPTRGCLLFGGSGRLVITGKVPTGVAAHSISHRAGASLAETVSGAPARAGRQDPRWPVAFDGFHYRGTELSRCPERRRRRAYCIMVGLHRQTHRIQGCGAMLAPDGEFPSFPVRARPAWRPTPDGYCPDAPPGAVLPPLAGYVGW